MRPRRPNTGRRKKPSRGTASTPPPTSPAFWPRRAAYGAAARGSNTPGLAETPALVIRFCLERDREADPKYFLTVRNTEEAWHLECFHRYAEACGGYVERPANPRGKPLFNRSLYRDALDAELGIDGYVFAHCAFVDGLECELTRAWRDNARSRWPAPSWIAASSIANGTPSSAGSTRSVARRCSMMRNAPRSCRRSSRTSRPWSCRLQLRRARHRIDATAEIADLAAVAQAGLGAISAEQKWSCSSATWQSRARVSPTSE